MVCTTPVPVTVSGLERKSSSGRIAGRTRFSVWPAIEGRRVMVQRLVAGQATAAGAGNQDAEEVRFLVQAGTARDNAG